MALDLENRLRRYLVSAPQNLRRISVLSFSHSAMSKTWHLWREPTPGTVTIEGGAVVEVEPANLLPVLAGTPADLDQAYKVALDTTDINDKFQEELDRIPIDTTEFMRLVYREYLSDDLTAPLAEVSLEVLSATLERGTAGIVAHSPRYNVSRTGEVYAPREVPMLRAFI